MDTDLRLIGDSPAIAHLLRTVPLIAGSDASVLIQGETGTGKERVAQLIHQASNRSHQPLFCINCAAIPEAEMELDWFGRAHEDGTVLSAGTLMAAAGGTVLLDEIDTLPLSIQPKLLRFLEAGECQLLGSHRIHRVDTRILATCSVDLLEKVQRQQFRADLYYRLQVLMVDLPPLRDRDGDIAPLLQHFLQYFAGKNAPVRLAKSALQPLLHYPWPGNVRELMNFCQRAALLRPGAYLQAEDIPSLLMSEPPPTGAQFVLPKTGIDLAQVELDLIQQALEMSAGNRSKAARLLGISRDTLLYRMQKYQLSADDKAED